MLGEGVHLLGRRPSCAGELLHVWCQSLPHTSLVSPVRGSLPIPGDRKGPVPLQTPKSSWARQALKLRITVYRGHRQTRSSMWCAGVAPEPSAVFIFN